MGTSGIEQGEVLRPRQSGLSWRQLEDEVVILDLENSHYVNLNGSAALAWVQMIDGASLEDVVAILVKTYEVDADRARADVGALIGDLRNLGLLAT